MKATTANTPRRPGWLREAICWTFGLVDAREVRLANAKGAEWKRLLDDANNDRRRMRDDLQALTAARDQALRDRDQALRERDQARLERIEACKEAKESKEVAEATRGALDRARESLDHTGLKCDACEGAGEVEVGDSDFYAPPKGKCEDCGGYGYKRHSDEVRQLREEIERLHAETRDWLSRTQNAMAVLRGDAPEHENVDIPH